MSQILENANLANHYEFTRILFCPKHFVEIRAKPQFGERFAPVRVPGTSTGFRFGKQVILLRTLMLVETSIGAVLHDA